MLSKLFPAFVLAIYIFVPAGGIARATADEITVSAAISLKNAFEAIAKLYEAKHHSKVFLNFGASGDLAKQIECGAPVDVFASAAEKDMDMLEGKGLLFPGTRLNFAANSVVLIVPLQRAPVKGFGYLEAAAVKKIATGNPKTVPAGRYAKEVMEYYKLTDRIKDKLVFTENVRQVLDYVARGEADAGMVYATDAALRAKETRVVLTAPEDSHKPVVYPVAMIRETKNQTSSKKFISFVTSAEGRAVLQKYGFKSVTGK